MNPMPRDKHRSDREHREPGQATVPAPGLALAIAADRECRRIGRALADARHRHHGIHRARKGIRTLRALLGLLEPALDEANRVRLRRLDTRLKRVCRGLSPLRDAHVAAVTAGALRDTASPEERQVLEAALVAHRDGATEEALRQDPAFGSRREAIAVIRQEIGNLPWTALDARAAKRAIKRSRRRTERAERKAHRSPTSPLRHRWRRRLRRLRLQLQAYDEATAVETAAPSSPGSSGHRALKRQTDRLGHLQDVQLLCRLARRIEPIRNDPHLRAVLAATMREARAEFAAGS